MRTVTQRVKRASVYVEEKLKCSINQGLLVLLGIENTDNQEDIDYLVKKISNLRIFNDENGVMNRSVIETKGDVIIVSQFTLHASTRKGNRPSYIQAAKPEIAIPLYEAFCKTFNTQLGKEARTGTFGANMALDFINDGPVTIVIDSKLKE